MEGKPKKGISVDAAVSGNPGPGKFRVIDIKTGALLHERKLAKTSNNIAEFLALVMGVYYAKKIGEDYIVYSDSTTAIAWFNKRAVNSKMLHQKGYETVSKFVAASLEYIRDNEGVEVERWITREWGENPADYGYKK